MTVINADRVRAAEAASLEIIGSPNGEYKDNKKYLLYRFRHCGHEQNIDCFLVKKQKFKCRQCEQEALEQRAASRGLKLIERASKGVLALYMFLDCGHTKRIGYTAVERGHFKCRECMYDGKDLETVRCIEASKQGLDYVGKTDDAAICEYKRIFCGHTIFYQHSAVAALNRQGYSVKCSACFQEETSQRLVEQGARMLRVENSIVYFQRDCGHFHNTDVATVRAGKIPKCEDCRTEKLKDLAKKLGLEATNENAVLNDGLYRFTSCGHTTQVRLSLVNQEKFTCRECEHERRISYIESLGATVKSFEIVDGRRQFRVIINKCNHERIIDPGQFSKRAEGSELVCFVCSTERHILEARQRGLELIGRAKIGDANYREYAMPCCGNIQELEITHVRNGNFCCHHCNETKYDKPTSVYLFHIENDGHEWLKLGVSIDPARRVKDYGLPETAVVTELYTNQYPDGHLALRVEKELHRIFKDHRLCIDSMRNKHTESGFTECYPIEMKSVLLEELNKYKTEVVLE